MAKWKEVLESSIEELHTSHKPASSKILQEHYSKIHNMHLDLTKVEHSLANQISKYKELLESSLNMILLGDRAYALAYLRYASDAWLPRFATSLEEQ